MAMLMQTPDTLTDKDHQRVASFVQRVAGIQLPVYKRQLIETRLRKRLKANGIARIADYLDFVFSEQGSAEQAALIDAITTNKTDFFREPAHFDYLTGFIIQQLKRGHYRRGPVKLWSAACSSGEEPYTLAMLLTELQQDWPEFDFSIRATDICSTVLGKAQNAVYRYDRIAPIAESLRKKYLLKSKDPAEKLFRIIKPLRQKVEFSLFNLINDAYPDKPQFDMIFCRNVMIYFNEQDRAKVIRELVSCLVPGGLLFLGHSETVGNQRAGLRAVSPTVYQRVA